MYEDYLRNSFNFNGNFKSNIILLNSVQKQTEFDIEFINDYYPISQLSKCIIKYNYQSLNKKNKPFTHKLLIEKRNNFYYLLQDHFNLINMNQKHFRLIFELFQNESLYLVGYFIHNDIYFIKANRLKNEKNVISNFNYLNNKNLFEHLPNMIDFFNFRKNNSIQ